MSLQNILSSLYFIDMGCAHMKLINLAVATIVASFDKPMRLPIKVGFMMACFFFFYAVCLTCRKFFLDIPVEKWTSIMVLLCFLDGLIIANLRIIGIYPDKVFDERKKRPMYMISKRINV